MANYDQPSGDLERTISYVDNVDDLATELGIDQDRAHNILSHVRTRQNNRSNGERDCIVKLTEWLQGQFEPPMSTPFIVALRIEDISDKAWKLSGASIVTEAGTIDAEAKTTDAFDAIPKDDFVEATGEKIIPKSQTENIVDIELIE